MCALPANPTVTNIKTEALNMAGVDSPSADDLTRADKWFQEVLDHIWLTSFKSGNTRLKGLENGYLDISTDNIRTLALPEDFDQEISVNVWDSAVASDDRGTAQSGTNTTIKLASGEDITQVAAEGKYIIITGGTGVDEFKQITAYNATTKVATVESAWTTNPDSTSTYLVVTKNRPLIRADVREFDDDAGTPAPGIPSEFTVHDQTMIFNRPWDTSTYGVFVRYHMHIHQVNLTEGNTTRIVRLLRNWRHVLTVGIAYKALESEDNDKYLFKKQEFDQGVVALTVKDQPVSPFSGFTV